MDSEEIANGYEATKLQWVKVGLLKNCGVRADYWAENEWTVELDDDVTPGSIYETRWDLKK